MDPVELRLDLFSSSELIELVFGVLLFELKDLHSLKIVENAMQELIPGDYTLVTWASIDTSLDVIVQFASVEEFMLFQMKWK